MVSLVIEAWSKLIGVSYFSIQRGTSYCACPVYKMRHGFVVGGFRLSLSNLHLSSCFVCTSFLQASSKESLERNDITIESYWEENLVKWETTLRILDVRDSWKSGDMYVDDSIFCEIHTLVSQAMATSIDTLFLIFGADKDFARKMSLGMDKYFQTGCSFQRIQLDYIINTQTMYVSLTNEKRNKIQIELNH